MKQSENIIKNSTNRRSFLTKGMMAAGVAAAGAGLLNGKAFAFDRND